MLDSAAPASAVPRGYGHAPAPMPSPRPGPGFGRGRPLAVRTRPGAGRGFVRSRGVRAGRRADVNRDPAMSEQWCTGGARLLRQHGDLGRAAADGASGRLMGAISLRHTDWVGRVTRVTVVAARGRALGGRARPRHRGPARDQQVGTARSAVQPDPDQGRRRQHRVAPGWRRNAGSCSVFRNAGCTPRGQVDLVMYGLIPADLIGT
jgi:hypothetical protein